MTSYDELQHPSVGDERGSTTRTGHHNLTGATQPTMTTRNAPGQLMTTTTHDPLQLLETGSRTTRPSTDATETSMHPPHQMHHRLRRLRPSSPQGSTTTLSKRRMMELAPHAHRHEGRRMRGCVDPSPKRSSSVSLPEAASLATGVATPNWGPPLTAVAGAAATLHS
jgi:hypothetical protein